MNTGSPSPATVEIEHDGRIITYKAESVEVNHGFDDLLGDSVVEIRFRPLEGVEQWNGNGPSSDPVNHPSHYTGFSNGAEVIDITEHLSFCRGNAVKYLARAGRKDPAAEIQDLEKARWYIEREINHIKNSSKENE